MGHPWHRWCDARGANKTHLPRDVLAANRSEVLAIAETHGITNVRVFGSVTRGEDGPNSDIDLLVTAPSGMGLMRLSAFALAIENLLGVYVDVVTDGGTGPDHLVRRAAEPL